MYVFKLVHCEIVRTLGSA